MCAAGQRERMLAATERLQKTSDRLHVGKQQLAETEVSHMGVGAGIEVKTVARQGILSGPCVACVWIGLPPSR